MIQYKYSSWLSNAQNKINTLNDASSNEAFLILSFVTKQSIGYLRLNLTKALTDDEYILSEDLLQKRMTGMPLAYVIGESYFWDLTLQVSKDTLIPRFDTEILIEQAILLAKKYSTPRILDLGTGTGAIALSLAKELPHAKVSGIDYKSSIIDLAKLNALHNEILNIHFYQSNWFSNVNGEYEIIVANPPYIDSSDIHLKDLTFEPRTALVAENKGFADLFYIIDHAKEFLIPNGYLLLEHGYNQGNEVREYFTKALYSDVKTIVDYGGQDRVTLGKWNN